MNPDILHLGHEPRSYFLLLGIGFVVATALGMRWAKRLGLDASIVFDVGLLSVVWGIIGGRLLHVIADGYFMNYVNTCIAPERVGWRVEEALCDPSSMRWDRAAELCRPLERDCFAWISLGSGGFAYYGGFILAAIMCVRFLRREKFPVWRGADMAGMSIPIGLFFGRLGCFLSGCCFGQRTSGALGVSFPAYSPASEQQWRDHLLPTSALPSLPVHPAQLYEAIGALVLAAVLMLYVHPRKRRDGDVFFGFAIGYSVLRFIVEYFRADDRGGLFGISTSQLISVAVVAVCVVLMSRRAAAAATPGPVGPPPQSA